MQDIWVISDTHFFHKNILNFTDNDGNLIRGAVFAGVEDMNQQMLDNWNSVVKPGDIVYHLGDVMLGAKDEFASFWPKLNGRKRLVVGNHDNIKYMSSGSFFQKVQMWRQFPDFGLLFSHVPLDPSGLYDYRNDRPYVNVHGHIHHHESPTDRHRNVSVEAINYTPIHIEELRIY